MPVMYPSSGQGLKVLVLGPTELYADGSSLRIVRPLERALVVRLALARRHGVPDEMLAGDLWGQGQVDKPSERLRVLAYRVRRTLGGHAGALHRSANGYALEAVTADLAQVEQALLEIQAARRDGRLDRIDSAASAALALWRGPALADVRTTPFGALEAARLDSLHLDVRTEWLEGGLARGISVVTEADQLAKQHPLNERLVQLAAIALYRAGRQADALTRLDELRQALADELGIDPSPESAELRVKLLRQDPSLAAPPQANRVHAQAPARRPDSGTPMIGRDDEFEALLKRLSEPAVVTLTGGPGMGKTRLAREVARATAESGRRVIWLDLARVSSAGALLPSLAAAAEVDPGAEDPLPLCLDSLTGALLVVDNAEHLIDPVADLLSMIDRHSGQTSVLVTSQQPVRIPAEEVRPIGPLGRDDAIRLFLERSHQPAGDRPELVDEICTAVDRLPLAIELAAGLTRTFTVEQLAARIEHRLRLLVGGTRTAGGRHCSLRAAIDWSCSLLEPATRHVLYRLAVFSGGFTLEAAEQVVGGDELQPAVDLADVAAILAQLHDRSLLTIDPGQHAHRMNMLQSVRDYALEQLQAAGNELAVRSRHAAWCADLAARTQRYGGLNHELLVRELCDEEANVRSAIEWALSADSQSGRVLEIAGPTWWYWWSHGQMTESRDWLRRALAAEAPEPTPARAAALRAAASLTRNSGDPSAALPLGLQALDIYRSLDDATGCISILVGLAITNLALRNYPTALEQATEAVELARPAGNTRLLASAVNVAGGTLRGLGRTSEAEQAFIEACGHWRVADDRRGLAGTLGNLGLVYQQTGDLERSRQLCLEALRIYRKLDLTEGMLDIVELIANLEVAAGRPETALRLLTVAALQRIRIGAPLVIADELDARTSVEEAARAALGPRAEHVATASCEASLDELVAALLANESSN